MEWAEGFFFLSLSSLSAKVTSIQTTGLELTMGLLA
jgi:hypothetical protein